MDHSGIVKNIEYVKSQPDMWYEAHPMIRDLVDVLDKLLKENSTLHRKVHIDPAVDVTYEPCPCCINNG